MVTLAGRILGFRWMDAVLGKEAYPGWWYIVCDGEFCTDFRRQVLTASNGYGMHEMRY